MQFPRTKASVHTLPNGLTVILDADPAAPVVSTQAWVQTGSIHEGSFLGAGISHLLEHMVFKGAEKYDGNELSDTVQSAGGEWNAYTTFDRTVYYIDGPSTSTETFLDVLLEMVFKPSFPSDEFEKEKDVIRREIDMGMDDPDDRNGRLLYSTAFGSDPRSQPVIGHRELFDQLSYEDMLHYHQTRYTTGNTFLSIAGDIDPIKVIDFLTEKSNSIPRRSTHPVEVSSEPPQLGSRTRSESFAVSTTKLTMAWQTPPLEHPDTPALDLLATILGTGRSSRLYRNIRENTGLCHQIGAWCMSPPQQSGMFAISATVDPDNCDPLQHAVISEIEKLIKADLTDELQKAKRMTQVSQIRTLATASGKATDLASNWHETRNLDFTRDFLESIEHVTPSDIVRCAESYLVSHKQTTTTLIPEGSESQTASHTNSVNRSEIESRTLSNGLTLVMMHDNRLPTVSITMATLAGLASETAENAGINTLLSRLMPKGTITRTAEQIADALDSRGASLGLSCGNNTTLGSASCLTDDLPDVLEIFSDVIQNPSIPPEAMERERDAMIAAIREQQQDPLSVAFLKMRPALFGKNGYGLNSLGTEDSLAALTRESLASHHREHFTASNSVLAVFGDIDPEQIHQQVENLFSSMPQGTRMQPASNTAPDPAEYHEQLDKKQAILTIGFQGACASDDDTHALELIHDYCTDMAGPLFTKIREELGLAYYVSATQFYGIHTGMFAFYMGTSPDQLDTARVVLLDEIQKIAEHGIPADSLESVKTTWLASHALGNQKVGSLARLSAIDSLLGFPPDNHMKAPDAIRKLSARDIKATAKKYFSKTPVTITVAP